MSQTLDIKNKKNNLTNIIEVPLLDEESFGYQAKSKLDSKGRAYSTGRRKESTARLWFSVGNEFKIDKNSIEDYFKNQSLVEYVLKPLKLVGMNKGKIFSTVSGGGKVSQAGALRLALSKALCLFDHSFREVLKQHGMLTTDSRRKEREHYGYRTSRKPQQYCRR